MKRIFSILPSCLLLALLGLLAFGCRRSSTAEDHASKAFAVEEASIAGIHAAYEAGTLTCRKLVELYLDRIEIYDQATGLNSLVVVNPDALRRADELDREYRETGTLRPLHGIPMIIKDNYDTFDLQTTAGSLALKGSIPPDDAFQVGKLREAGVVILAKSNMAEWAFSPVVTESSIAGVTRNPYDLERVPAGSSGGTAASVAANLAVAGLGTDTGNSIRGPSSHCCLVGIRSSMGLTSRDGIVPLYLRNDIGGPMARTVEDAARILDVIAGPDPADPITLYGKDHIPDSYTRFLDKEGLRDARIGIFRFYTQKPTTDAQILELFDRAVDHMRGQGAEIVDPFIIPDFETLTDGLWCDTFHHDVNAYLASLGDRTKYKTLAEIVKSGLYSAYIEKRLKQALEIPPRKEPTCGDLFTEPKNKAFREAVLNAMDAHHLDVLVYPTWSNPPRKIGDLESPAGDNSQIIPPHTGLPGLTVPMGFTPGGLPSGLQIVGRLFGEADIIKIAYAYEQSTRHRRPPEAFPPIEK